MLLVLVSACTGTAPPSDAEPSAREPPPSAPTVTAPATAAKPVTDAKTEVLQLALDLPPAIRRNPRVVDLRTGGDAIDA